MKILNKFKNYLLEKNKKSFIESVIDDEIKKTNDFGLEIEKEHILSEKKLLVFLKN